MRHPGRLIPDRPIKEAKSGRWSSLTTAACLIAWSGPHLLAATRVVDPTLSGVVIIGTVSVITCCMANSGWWPVICADFLDSQQTHARGYDPDPHPIDETMIAWPREPLAWEDSQRFIRPRPRRDLF